MAFSKIYTALAATALQATRAEAAGGANADGLPRFHFERGHVIEQYELIRELGRGGMGMVYLARDVRLGRRVAIKFLAHDDPSRAARFQAEARVTARCKHENIVVIYDIGEVQGYSFMALEYVEGITLRAWLRQRWQRATDDAVELASEALAPTLAPTAEPVSASLAAELMIPVVRALAHAHSLGLVHRDLKPENIMLARDGGTKVLDFGIAKVLAAQARQQTAEPDKAQQWAQRDFETRADVLVGTMPYMSPEQWGAGEVDERSDLWAVGIMLWELVAGRHPLAPLSVGRLGSVSDLELSMPSMVEIRPELGPLAGVIDRCLRKRSSRRTADAGALLAELEAVAAGRHVRHRSVADEPEEPEEPFAGLAAFQEGDAARFFGRDRDIASVVARLRNRRMITLLGPSGTGKSSFVRAGVIPALKRSGQRWESFIIRPGRRPMGALTRLLGELEVGEERASRGEDDEAQVALLERLHAQPGYLGAVLRERCRDRRSRVLLLCDQFEELYTLGASFADRAAFVGCLEGVADDASSPLRVVLSLRSDFLDQVAEDRALTREITRGIALLPPMARDDLRQTLVRPLAATGYAFESSAMVESMLDELEATRAPLPLLQFTAARLWAARDRASQQITEASYEASGGVAGALAIHADAVLASMSSREQRLARLAFSNLVTDERTRAIVSQSELRALAPAGDSDAMVEVVLRLADARLLLIESDADRGATVELCHESLIGRWPTLGRWLDEQRDDALFRARLRTAARQWHEQERSEDLLWRGRAAADAGRWLESWRERVEADGDNTRGRAELGERDRDYLDAVVGLAQRARRRRRRLRLAAFAAVSAVALIFLLLALSARRSAVQAREQSARADVQAVEAARLAAEASAQAERATNESMLARDASRMAAATTARSQDDPNLVLALVRELESSTPPKQWEDLARWALHRGVARTLIAHQDEVNDAAFSPDGQYLVIAGSDKVALVLAADGSGDPLVLTGHRELVNSAAFSPDGRRIVTASFDGTARVWNADGSGGSTLLQGHRDRVTTAEFSPDGTRVVTASRDGTARVFTIDGGNEPLVLEGHRERVYSARFSPDGTRVLTASGDRTARVWSADRAGRVRILRAHEDIVYSAAFSPDGTRIATASRDGTARVQAADGSGEPVVLRGHLALVYSVAFSPDGARIATASYDKTARVWNADGTGEPLVLRGHQDIVYTARFSPDGAHVATASRDQAVRVYAIDGVGRPVVLRGHQDVVYTASFSPDGQQVATASFDGTARLHVVDGSGTVQVLRGHSDRVTAVAFSADGARLVTGSSDRTARVWHIGRAESSATLRGHLDLVHSVAFSPDGTRVVTASFDRTARVWQADGRDDPVVLRGHEDQLYMAGFSPDGTRVVTASIDGTARIFAADGRGAPIVLRGHEGAVHSALFNRDGTRVVTASRDGTARIWRADGTGQERILRGHQDRVSLAMFTRYDDRQAIVTLSADRTMRVWSANDDTPPQVLRLPDLNPSSSILSPDGTRIVSTSHSERRTTATGTVYTEHTAVVWPDIEQFSGLNDPGLWTATSFCPAVELRMELLGVLGPRARTDRELCLRRVVEASARSGE